MTSFGNGVPAQHGKTVTLPMASARGGRGDAGADAGAVSTRLSRLYDAVAPLIVPMLELEELACAACTRRAWRAAASDPAQWVRAELSFERAVWVTDEALALLCSRAGPALRTLCVDSPACDDVTAAGLVAALRDGGCAGLLRLCMSSEDEVDLGHQHLTVALAAQLAAACPVLEHTACTVRYDSLEEAYQAAPMLPGPLALHAIQGPERNTLDMGRLLLPRTVVSLTIEPPRPLSLGLGQGGPHATDDVGVSGGFPGAITVVYG